MTTQEIQMSVQRWLYDCNHHYQCLNYGKTGYFEADVLGVTLSRMVTEVEVKISMSDFKADFKKTAKHLRLSFPDKADFINACIPNRFYYACPEGLIPIGKIPGYAGLIYVNGISGEAELIKLAPILHHKKAADKLMIGMLSNLTAKTIFGCQIMTHKARESKIAFDKYQSQLEIERQKYL